MFKKAAQKMLLKITPAFWNKLGNKDIDIEKGDKEEINQEQNLECHALPPNLKTP